MAWCFFTLTPAVPEKGVGIVVRARGFTDSQVSEKVGSKLSSGSFPLCAITMELSAQCERMNAELELLWSPREVNQEADDLSNGKTDAFDPKLEKTLDPSTFPWIVLNEATREGMEFYKSVPLLKEQKQNTAQSSWVSGRQKKAKLRETDPW